MKTKNKIALFLIAASVLAAGIIYVYHKAMPPKGKAIGILELPAIAEKETDKVFRLADINNDKLAEIVLLKKYDDNVNKIFLLDNNGNIFDSWPQDAVYPALGDVNNDGYKEIVDIVNNKVYVYDQFGTPLEGFPLNLENQPVTIPILADLDSDNNLEIILCSKQPLPVVNVIGGNGYPKEGWPKEIFIPSEKTDLPMALAVGDINKDTETEIVVLALDRLFVLNNKGEIISKGLQMGLPEDGKKSIFLADFNPNESLKIVLVYGNTVSVRNIDEELFNIIMQEDIQYVMLGDLNGDNLPEIVLSAADQKVYVYDNKGVLLEGWPVGNIIGYPIIGDIDSDGINEIIAVTKPFDEFQISAYGIKGLNITGWPINVKYRINSTLALADINNDRLIEIVFADTEDNIHIIKTAGIVTKGSWPEPFGNIYNNKIWEPDYMLIDKERGITNKEEVLSEASSIIPEYIKPEFKILAAGRDLSAKEQPVVQPKEKAEAVEIKSAEKKGKPDVGTLPIPENLALTARIEASSEYSDHYKALNISDGLLGQWDEGEWASRGEQTPWIKLSWDTPQTINTVVLYDRPNRFDEILNAGLEFSDGSSIVTGMLPNSGSPKKIIFNDKNVDWVKVQILEGSGSLNAGLAEIEVFYDKPMDQELNLANKAKIKASTEYSAKYQAENIADGLLGQWDEGEWASKGEQTPWIQLNWDKPQIINTVVLYDRPNKFDQILNARLEFSDGTSLVAGLLPNSGAPKEIVFNDKIVEWLKFQILEGSGSMNAGLAELEVFYSDKRKNECNLALTAEVTASSTYSPKYEPVRVIDGQLGQWDAGEWASKGEQTPWIKLSWDTPQTADMVLLYDRPNRFDEILNARLEFSDGSSIVTGMLPNSGAPKQIIFCKKTFDWVKLQILEGSGSLNAGLAEFEVFYSKDVLKKQKEAFEKKVIIDYEVLRLTDMDPSLIYKIVDSKIVDGRLISYTCEVTNSIGTIKRIIYCEILYDNTGNEIGWTEYGRIEDGRIQYRAANSDKDGNRIIWFAEAITEEDTIEETVARLKQMAEKALDEKKKQELIDKEIAKLKDIDPALIYTIIDTVFENGKLKSYTCLVTNTLGTIKRTVYVQILYNDAGDEIGGAEYGLVEDGRLQCRLWKTNSDGKRQIFIAGAIGAGDALLLKEISRIPDKFPIGRHNILLFAEAGELVQGEDVTEEEKKTAIAIEVSKLKNIDPALIYIITEPKFLKGKLISYTCQVTNSLNTINRTVYGEIYYDETGSEIDYAEYGKIEDGRMQYRFAKTNPDGNRQIIFAKVFECKDAGLLKELARSAIKGLGIEGIGFLFVPEPVSIQTEDKTPAEWKKMLIEREIEKLKNIDPALIYIIDEPVFVDRKLIKYKCRVTNSIGTINRTVYGHLYYNEKDIEIGYTEYGVTEDGKTQYRLARTNKDGNRQIFFAGNAAESQGFVLTMDILKKMLAKVTTDTELIYTLFLIYSGDLQFLLPQIQINDFAYQLQNIDLGAIGNTEFDMAIIDYSTDRKEYTTPVPPDAKPKHIAVHSPIHLHNDNLDRNRFTKEEIATLKNSSGGKKIVIAYMSIGEAENYRWYWKDTWDKDNDGNRDSNSPSWLGPSTSQGRYNVKYWEPAWQAIIYGSPTSYLDKIIEAGFDGVYIDNIDAYAYYRNKVEVALGSTISAEEEMIDFVKAITLYARNIKGQTDFIVVAQNGEGLSSYPDYVKVIDGIGKEVTWHTEEAIKNLDVFKNAGKLVMVVDYINDKDLIDDFYKKAQEKGYVPYATKRELNVLTINQGHEPD